MALVAVALFLQLLTFTPHLTHTFPAPSFQSNSLRLKAQDLSANSVSVAHGLGEVPLLVRVLMTPKGGPSSLRTFLAMGAAMRDDDHYWEWGQVVYAYTDTEVFVAVPSAVNGQSTGRPYCVGAQGYTPKGDCGSEKEVDIVVLCWTESVLIAAWGAPRLNESVPVNTDVKSLIDVPHTLNDYPEFAVVRTQAIIGGKNWYADGVGASNTIITPNFTPGFLVYALHSLKVRAWYKDGKDVNKIADGFGSISKYFGREGNLEVYGWSRVSHLIATCSLDVSNQQTTLELPYNVDSGSWATVYVNSTTSPGSKNHGFLFPALPTTTLSADASGESDSDYGGIAYNFVANKKNTIELWYPTGANGYTTLVKQYFGSNEATEMSKGGQVVVYMYGNHGALANSYDSSCNLINNTVIPPSNVVTLTTFSPTSGSKSTTPITATATTTTKPITTTATTTTKPITTTATTTTKPITTTTTTTTSTQSTTRPFSTLGTSISTAAAQFTSSVPDGVSLKRVADYGVEDEIWIVILPSVLVGFPGLILLACILKATVRWLKKFRYKIPKQKVSPESHEMGEQVERKTKLKKKKPRYIP